MTILNKSTAGTPPDDFRLHRFLEGEVDIAPFRHKPHGVVMNEHVEALIQVCPEGGANPAVSVFWWSEGANAGAGEFIVDHTPITFLARGADVPWEAVVPCRGRRMFVAVTAGVAGLQKCRVYVAGFNSNLGR